MYFTWEANHNLMSETQSKSFFSETIDFLKDLVIIVLIVFVIRTFLIMPFQINGQSMYDSYYNGEFIIVDRFSYRDMPFLGSIREPQRGDVIVFKPGVSEEKEYFIKRIIWLPWETLKIENGKVYIEESREWGFIELEEGYLNDANQGRTYVKQQKSEHVYEIPEGKYFVIGDNRQASTDSRTCFSTCSIRTNYIDMSMVTGKVFVDLWYFSFKNFGFIHPDITEEWLPISTLPRFFDSPGTYSY